MFKFQVDSILKWTGFILIKLKVHFSDEQIGQVWRDNRVFSHDVTAAILVSQNNETAAMLVTQTSPVHMWELNSFLDYG